MHHRITRRRLLRNTALAGITICGTGVARAFGQQQTPNEKLNVAGIGIGGRGAADVGGVASENIVALCDVDEKRAGPTFQRFPKAQKFKDFRKMLDEIQNRIDAVVIGTPDHTHAPPAAMAMRLGKHCYCEKPLTHSVHETRVLTELAVENKLATQLGTQIHAGSNYRRVVELVRSGAIGPVDEVHVWHGGSRGGMDRPKETPPVPPHLDWDLWLGPAPYRPYHPCYVPGNWRNWWDFANGTLGDFGCHYMDLPFWALQLKYPVRVEADGPPPHPETAAPRLTVRYQFPARDNLPPVQLTWYNGGTHRDAIAKLGVPVWGAAVLFIGSAGMLLADYGKRLLLPQAKFKDFSPPEPTIPSSVGHHREWVDACKTGAPTTCNFAYSGPLTEAVLLGDVAYRAQAGLDWDAKNLKATNCDAADNYLRREYRQGWTL
jgi:predicted dehydrogenase